MVDAGAILFTVLLAIVEIRHYVTGGDIYRRTERRHGSHALRQCRLGDDHRARTRARAHRQHRARYRRADRCGADACSGRSCDLLRTRWIGQFLPVGGAFVNLILLGYGLPAALAIIAGADRPHYAPDLLSRIAAITAVTLALFYLTLEVRRLFHGPMMWGHISDAEQYTLSTVWLAFGIVLLAVGFFLRSQPARLLALGVIALTIAKVFIVRHREHQRHLPRDVGDRARRRAARHRLALSTSALSARTGRNGGSYRPRTEVKTRQAMTTLAATAAASAVY